VILLSEAWKNDLSFDQYEVAEPRPDAMLHSSRSIGYDLPTAIADVLDNSITAKANNIWVDFYWNGEDSWISIRDDGDGMTEPELIEAMRLGSLSPLEKRSERDLGRFGLGLKTASFSQCKRLVVQTKNSDTEIFTRCWDLDYISYCCKWRLLKQIGEATATRLNDELGRIKGTTVLWECLDRLVSGNQKENRVQEDRFLKKVEQVYKHVAMVFHKYIDRPNGIKIFINGNKVESWNPFLPKEQATQGLTEEHILFKDLQITVLPYVLPHQSRLITDFKIAGGTRGWNDMQGFYVYRNNRLLVAGDWLGLGFQKEEHCKLARIELNFPSDLDGDWNIDVKKSCARPPAAIRDDLKRIASITRTRATEVYRARGKLLVHQVEPVVALWQTLRRNGKSRYVINRFHPAVESILGHCPEPSRRMFRDSLEVLLRLIEETIPSGITVPEAGVTVHSKSYDTKEIQVIAELMYRSLIANGKNSEQALEMMSLMAPFHNYPEILATLPELEEIKN
jgi:hypothetical protein